MYYLNDEYRFKEDLSNFGKIVKTKTKTLCSTQTLRNKFPIINWLPKYRASYLLEDFIAGLTVGLTTIPQAIAYGVVAGLEPQYGLYSAFMGCFTYIIFGSCKDVTIATTAIMAIMVQPYAIQNPDFAVLLCFLAGCIILALGLLNLGVLIRFISVPVITGFTIAAATTIASAQLNNLFGIASSSNKFFATWKNFFTNFTTLHWPDAVLGISTLVFLLLMKKVKNINFGSKSFWKYVSLSRNALAVILGTFLAYLLSYSGSQPFRVTGNITAGLPPFRLPPFSTEVNGTKVEFAEMIATYGATLGFVPLVAILEVVAIAKAFSKGKIVNASQEMIALGMCNIMGSLVFSMPVTGSFTRTAVNNASGVRTQLGGAITGTFVLLALAFLTPTFYYIPKTTLAAIIIAAMITLVEYEKVISIWRIKKSDILPFMGTVITCLVWSLEYGILCGILVNLLFILFPSAKPELVLSQDKINDYDFGLVEVKQSLQYASAEFLKEKTVKFVLSNPDIKLIVIKGNEINSIDYTVAVNLISLKADLKMLNCDLICWQWNQRASDILCRANPEFCKALRCDSTIADIVLCQIKTDFQYDAQSTIICDEIM